MIAAAATFINVDTMHAHKSHYCMLCWSVCTFKSSNGQFIDFTGWNLCAFFTPTLRLLWTTMGRFGSNKFPWSNQLALNLWIIDKLKLSKNALAFSNRSIWVGSLKKFSGLNIDRLLFRLLVKWALPIYYYLYLYSFGNLL